MLIKFEPYCVLILEDGKSRTLYVGESWQDSKGISHKWTGFGFEIWRRAGPDEFKCEHRCPHCGGKL
jgi:hypothetical protein